jgi:hypothetical protein
VSRKFSGTSSPHPDPRKSGEDAIIISSDSDGEDPKPVPRNESRGKRRGRVNMPAAREEKSSKELKVENDLNEAQRKCYPLSGH